MTFRSLTLAIVSFAALAIPAPAAAQTEQQQKELAQALGNFTAAQRVLGMNELCEVLEHDAQTYAELMVREMKAPLIRALGTKFDPDSIHEDGRDALEGCKSRKDAPKAWTEIDNLRDTGLAFTVAASLISVNPEDCILPTTNRINADHFKAAANIALAKIAKDKRTEIKATAQRMAVLLDQQCPKNPANYYPSTFRPAAANVRALRRLARTERGKSNPALQAVGADTVEGVESDPWLGAWRSNLYVGPSESANRTVTGYRADGDSRAAVRVRLRSGNMFSGNGNLYFSRSGDIEARVDGDFDALVVRAVNSNKFYTLTRINKGVKPDFFGKNQAEFRMIEKDRDRFLSENDETANFRVFYRPTPKSNLKPFMDGRTGNVGLVNLGDLVRAFRWGTAPSAL